MRKTIKELADELRVSKDKVKYQVRKLPSELTIKENGITYIKNTGIEIIKENIQGKIPNAKTEHWRMGIRHSSCNGYSCRGSVYTCC